MHIKPTFELASKLPPPTRLLCEGKTKKIWLTTDPDCCYSEATDNITAGDGARSNNMFGKAALATMTTSNVFRLLNVCGIPTAFIKQASETIFLSKLCKMIPYEVVVRRMAYGSYLKGYPYYSKGTVFKSLVVQFFLKTTGKCWNGTILPVDDPLMIIRDGKGYLYRPDMPIDGQEPIRVLDDYPLMETPEYIEKMARLAKKAFLILEKAWQIASGSTLHLVDFKIEFGFDQKDNLILADVIDNDSWRVVDQDGNHLDKQTYRDGAKLDEVLGKYQIAAEYTNRFKIPEQKIVIWTGSIRDITDSIGNTITEVLGQEGYKYIKHVTCSMHKQTSKALYQIAKLENKYPNSVIITLVGMSNGAGPVLSAQSTLPVISVPANVKDFPNDIWSSLRMPSYVPVMTVLDGRNAALAAMAILAASNPYIYMCIRYDLEKRLLE
jgi:phosphoribosylaminoimidazole carboxylase/phosphoribosylaminoimidazole-succinocarboxamide synthase